MYHILTLIELISFNNQVKGDFFAGDVINLLIADPGFVAAVQHVKIEICINFGREQCDRDIYQYESNMTFPNGAWRANLLVYGSLEKLVENQLPNFAVCPVYFYSI